MKITGENMNALYRRALSELVLNPEYETSPRGAKIKERINVTLELTDPRNRIVSLPNRKLSLRYLAGELAFYFALSDDLNFISNYSKFWNNISDDGSTVNSCYGKKLMEHNLHPNQKYPGSQLSYAVDQLLKDRDSRKAISLIYSPENTDMDTKDNPCTMYLQFFIRNNKLCLIVNMRSNDIWFGFSYDLPFFTIIQELVYVVLRAQYKDLELGNYLHNAGSFHLYEKDFEKAELLIAEDNEMELFNPPAMPEMTDSTWYQLGRFLTSELLLRSGKTSDAYEHVVYTQDPFVRRISQYLFEE